MGGGFHAWHGVCEFLGAMAALALFPGCYYWFPLREIQPNLPPEVRVTSPEAGSPVVIDLDQYTVYIGVHDDHDNSALEFIWTINGMGNLGNAEPVPGTDIVGSRVTLEREASFDGHTLSCVVFDTEGASARVDWPIEVVEAAR